MCRPSIEPRNKCATSECRHGPNAWKATVLIPFRQGMGALGGVGNLGMHRRIVRGNRESLGVSAMERSAHAEQSSADRAGKGVIVR